MDNQDEQYNFIEVVLAPIWCIGAIFLAFILTLYFFSWLLKPVDYISEITVEQVMSTKPVVKHEVTVEANVTVSDEVTRRTMKFKMTTDSVTHDMIKTVNDNMLQTTYKMVDTRQREVDSDHKYWSKNIVNHNKEK